MTNGQQHHVIVWEFLVRPGNEEAFEEAYGAAGAWARLFRGGKGYLGTDLLRDTQNPARYLTIDRWAHTDDFVRFRETHAAEYEALDKTCESWTETETLLARCFAV